MDKVKVMAVINDDDKRFEIKSLLNNENIAFLGTSKSGSAALDKAISLRADVVLLYHDSESNDVIETAEKIFITIPGCILIMLCEKMDIAIMESAMHAGVRKVIGLPVSQEDLIEKIMMAFNMEKSRVVIDNKTASKWQSKVITIFGTKGGVGKTTVAVNVAVALAVKGEKVALIDLDLQFGDVNVYLDFEPKDTIAELVQERSTFDIDTLNSYMVLHSSGVNVLSGTKSPEYAEIITGEHIDRIINTLRPYYDYVIIDSSTSINDISVAAMEASSSVLMVVSLDIVTIRNARISMDVLEVLQQKEKVSLVVNRDFQSDIKAKDVQRILGTPVIHKIPSDFKSVVSSVNKGIPIVIDAPRGTVGLGLIQLADILKNK